MSATTGLLSAGDEQILQHAGLNDQVIVSADTDYEADDDG